MAVRHFLQTYFLLGACSHPSSSGVTTRRSLRWCIPVSEAVDVYPNTTNNEFNEVFLFFHIRCPRCLRFWQRSGNKEVWKHSNRAKSKNTFHLEQNICKPSRKKLGGTAGILQDRRTSRVWAEFMAQGHKIEFNVSCQSLLGSSGK